MSSWNIKTPKQLLRYLVEKAYGRWHAHQITSRNPLKEQPSGKIGELTTNLDEKDTELLKQLTSDDAQDIRIESWYHNRVPKKQSYSSIIKGK